MAPTGLPVREKGFHKFAATADHGGDGRDSSRRRAKPARRNSSARASSNGTSTLTFFPQSVDFQPLILLSLEGETNLCTLRPLLSTP